MMEGVERTHDEGSLQRQGREKRCHFSVHSQEFLVQEGFEVVKELGQGAYGIVVYSTPSCLGTQVC